MQHSKRWAGAAGAVLALLLILLMFTPAKSYLLLREANSGRVMYHAALAEGEEFSVSYTHSVNKSEVEEYYQSRGGNIYLIRLVYAAFGAGMPTDAYAEGGTTLSYDGEGRMVIAGYDRLLPRLVYNVGMVADHILHIGGESIHLTQIAQPQTALRFEIHRYRPWRAWFLS